MTSEVKELVKKRSYLKVKLKKVTDWVNERLMADDLKAARYASVGIMNTRGSNTRYDQDDDSVITNGITFHIHCKYNWLAKSGLTPDYTFEDKELPVKILRKLIPCSPKRFDIVRRLNGILSETTTKGCLYVVEKKTFRGRLVNPNMIIWVFGRFVFEFTF